MKKRLALAIWLMGLGLLYLIQSLIQNQAGADTAGIASPPGGASRGAALSERVTVQAADRGNPFINLSDGRELMTAYVGDGQAVRALQQNQARGLSLASDDFNEDGTKDLVCGYAAADGTGIVALHRGNVDAIYPYHLAAQERKARGEFTDAPFLSPARAFALPVAAEFLGTGDFDADGHWDVVAASSSGDSLYLLRGDGQSGLGEAERIEVRGRVTALAAGEINRADGLADLAVGVAGGHGPQLLVFEGPNGALRQPPEVFALAAEAKALELGDLDDKGSYDIGVAAGHELVVIHGRDRRPSLDDIRQADVEQASISRHNFSFAIAEIAVGDFVAERDYRTDIALLTEDGSLKYLRREGPGRGEDDAWQVADEVAIAGLAPHAAYWARQLSTAKVSTHETDDLVVIDGASRKLQIMSGDSATVAASGSRRVAAALESSREAGAVLPMRLTVDMLDSLVILKNGQSAPDLVMAAAAMTFTVTKTKNSGPGSLRQAILDANANNGLDRIVFNIQPGGPQSIQLLDSLPGITDPVTILGFTQPGFRDKPIIELNGAPAGSFGAGIVIVAGNSVVRGLVINRFKGGGIGLFGKGGNSIGDNFIGTDINGAVARGNRVHGVEVLSPNNTIGPFNVISGNKGPGVRIGGNEAKGNKVQGNRIGTDSSGTLDLGNSGNGVDIFSAPENTIGGTTQGAGNLISGNDQTGVSIRRAAHNRVQGNKIGTDVNGTAPLGNSRQGIFVVEITSFSSIVGNTIAFNKSSGVSVSSGRSNLISENSIFSNDLLGIDLLNDEKVQPNDQEDPDTGANALQNFPDLISAKDENGTLTIKGILRSTPVTRFVIEFFANPECDTPHLHGEGKTFIGSITVMTNQTGRAEFEVPISGAGVPGPIITSTATDPSGNTAEFSGCVRVESVEGIPCSLTCPPALTVNNEPNRCGANVNFAPTISGDCGTVTCIPPSGSFFPTGTTGVNCSTSTGQSCSFQVTVNDTQAPTITCPPNITQGTDANQCSAVVTYPNVVATDNCPNSGSPVCIPPSGTTFPIGTKRVDCAVSDAVGNLAFCSFTVTINDAQPPVITCPPNITVNAAPGQCSAQVNYSLPTAVDNCAGAGAVTCTPGTGSTFQKGTTAVNCTVADASGNMGSCSFTVTVNDTEAPTVTCSANIVAGTDPGQCSGTANYLPPSASDNCPGPLGVDCVPPPGSNYPRGTTPVTCTATDASGNRASCTFTVTVNDTQAPTITCPANIVTTTPGACVSVAFIASASDNCPGVSSSCSPPPFTCFPVGVTPVTCTATDAAGNVGTACGFTVTVNCPPVAITPASLPGGTLGGPYSQSISASGVTGPFSFAVVSGSLPPGLTLVPTAGGDSVLLNGIPAQTGTFNFTVRAAGANGCAATQSYTVVITCPTITVNPPSLPNGSVGVAYNQTIAAGGGPGPFTFAVTNGSLPPGLMLNPTTGVLSGTPAQPGTFTFTIRATNANGCFGERLYTITINQGGCQTITVNPATLPSGMVGQSYSQAFSATGGIGPFTFSISMGAVPGGLSLNPMTGILSGGPAASGNFSFTLRATGANACFGERSYTLTINPGVLQFFPLPAPVRLFDSRPGEQACFTTGVPLAGDTVRRQPAAGSCSGIPATAQAVVGNATVVNSFSTGTNYVSLFPSNAAQPNTSNIHYGQNETICGSFTVGLGPDDAFNIYSSGTTHFIVDITGYYAPPAAGGLYYHPLPTPIRIFDTQPGATACDAPGAPLGSDATRTQTVVGTCFGVTIPGSAKAVVGSATVVNPGSNGFITLYPLGTTQPTGANLNFTANRSTSNAFVVGLSSDGKLNIYSNNSTDFILDAAGYFSDQATDVNGAGLLYSALPTPVRLLDTQPGATACDTPGAPLGNNATRTQTTHGTCAGVTIPASARALIGTATVVNFISAGSNFISIFPFGAAQTNASVLHFDANRTVSSDFVTGLNNEGKFNIYSSASTHLIVDVAGYFR